MIFTRFSNTVGLLLVSAAMLFAAAPPRTAHATWSICIADTKTGEVAVGTVTCLTNFDLLAIVPVVVVGKGAAAVQAAGDFDGLRRPIIFNGLVNDVPLPNILNQLALITGHQQRQYGIVNTKGEALTFTGTNTQSWKGGIIGSQGTMVYAIQGNVLAGGCVVPAIEQAILNTDGDIPEKLMQGMIAARDAGGDGRCSCASFAPTLCGCPPPNFNKSGHIGGMIVARIGDLDDDVCNAAGCADGDYLMRLNVAFQPSGNPDPVTQLQSQFAAWRANLVGMPDAIRSTVTIQPQFITPNGISTATMHIQLLDWQMLPITAPIESVTVEHAPGSAGLSTIGKVDDAGEGAFTVTLTSGTKPGIDRFRVTVNEKAKEKPIILAPDATFEYFVPGDLNGDGSVGVPDLLILLASWGPCPQQPPPGKCAGLCGGPGPDGQFGCWCDEGCFIFNDCCEGVCNDCPALMPCDDPPSYDCPADLTGNGSVGIADLLILLANWS